MLFLQILFGYRIWKSLTYSVPDESEELESQWTLLLELEYEDSTDFLFWWSVSVSVLFSTIFPFTCFSLAGNVMSLLSPASSTERFVGCLVDLSVVVTERTLELDWVRDLLGRVGDSVAIGTSLDTFLDRVELAGGPIVILQMIIYVIKLFVRSFKQQIKVSLEHNMQIVWVSLPLLQSQRLNLTLHYPSVMAAVHDDCIIEVMGLSILRAGWPKS